MKMLLFPLPVLIAILLPSCEVPGGGSYYGGGGYSGGGYSQPYYDGYGHGGRPYYGGGNYRGGHYYNDHHSNDNHSNNSNRKGSEIKLIRGRDGDHPTRPTGYHTKDWYKHRGYDLSDYTHKHEDGKVHKGDDKDKKHKKDKH